jgi:hypothetical protein
MRQMEARKRRNIPPAGVTFTRRHQGFTHVRPSPRTAGRRPGAGKLPPPAGLLLACGPRMGHGPLRLLPRASHPQLPATHAEAETGQCALARVPRLRHQPDLQQRLPLELMHPHFAPTRTSPPAPPSATGRPSRSPPPAQPQCYRSAPLPASARPESAGPVLISCGAGPCPRPAGRHTLFPQEPPIVVDDVDTPSMNARDSYGEREARSFMASAAPDRAAYRRAHHESWPCISQQQYRRCANEARRPVTARRLAGSARGGRRAEAAAGQLRRRLDRAHAGAVRGIWQQPDGVLDGLNVGKRLPRRSLSRSTASA